MSEQLARDPWKTTRIVLKWCCRTDHDRWKKVGEGILLRGYEAADDLTAGNNIVEVHKNRAHKKTLAECLEQDPIRFWDLVYKYWRARGPHDGASRETIDLSDFEDKLS